MVTQVAVGRALLAAAAVADAGPDNAGEAPEPGVRSPESAQGKQSDLGFRPVTVDSGNRFLGHSRLLSIRGAVPGQGGRPAWKRAGGDNGGNERRER